MVNEYNNGDILCVVPNGGTKPTHGDYPVGALLYDNNTDPMLRGWWICSNTSVPITWVRLPNRFNLPRNPLRDGKYGVYMANSMTVKGEGMMADVQSVGGSFTGNASDGNGTAHSFATLTTIQNAGLAILRTTGAFSGLTRSTFLPAYFIKASVPARSSGDLRYYSGFPTTSGNWPLSDDPIAQADGGIAVGFNSTDTNFNVWWGDGTNPVTKEEITLSGTPIAVPGATVNRSFEIIFITATNALVNVYDGSLALIGSKNITTNLPPNAKGFNWSHCLQNPGGTNKSVAVYGACMEALR